MAELKQIQDYYADIEKLFPEIPSSDIKNILQFGWKQLYMINNYGGDILLKYPDLWLYFGSLTKDSIRHFDYYKRKMRIRLRIMYKRKKIQWDGFYYFALSQTQYNEYLKQKNKKGRPRKKFTFTKVVLYKIYDECSIIESSKVAIFRIPKILEGGFNYFEDSFTTDKAELILTREPLKFNDVLLNTYNYQFLTDCNRKLKSNTNASS